ncbi:hypothetical protein [Paenibacillus segetis]|uniref:DUF4358 domain-containing protein n=1 Tax=Paenibacillus segetis TaxID=1325360 RepID=A0ABQ1YA51_9BACL|nr:hypothetical protein [Paenibacillus segetis]GGH18208.1 hypothetical protein GCM10008013_14020 [Paenibacillus segetis]
MKWLVLSLYTTIALSMTVACSSGMQRTVKQEVDKYNMKSYQSGNENQRIHGTTLNTTFLQSLKNDCEKRGIRLTHETYSEGLDGNISYSYFINGDARDFIMVHVYPSESDRIREIAEIYDSGDGKGEVSALSSDASVISARGNTALVYASSGQTKNQYRDDMKIIFENLLDRLKD